VPWEDIFIFWLILFAVLDFNKNGYLKQLFYFMKKECLGIDGQQYHQYHQNQQPPLT
jgi:hypothetical protein